MVKIAHVYKCVYGTCGRYTISHHIMGWVAIIVQ